MHSRRPFLFLSLLLMAVAAPRLRAEGQPFEEERLVNVDSPHVVGARKFRFDFQHSWSGGKTFSGRLPVADLTLYFGLAPELQARFDGVFHNKDFSYRDAAGAEKKAVFHFNAFEYELQWRFLNQFAGAPLSASASGVFLTDRFRRAVETDKLEDGNKIPGVKLLAARDFGRWGAYGAWKWAQVQSMTGQGKMTVSSVAVGARLKLAESRRARVDLVADRGMLTIQQRRYQAAKDPWSAGLQFTGRSPHTITLFVSNTTAENIIDSMYGMPDTFKSFRWSYRF